MFFADFQNIIIWHIAPSIKPHLLVSIPISHPSKPTQQLPPTFSYLRRSYNHNNMYMNVKNVIPAVHLEHNVKTRFEFFSNLSVTYVCACYTRSYIKEVQHNVYYRNDLWL